MFLLVGPPRSGKGTIARVLTALLGPANVCGPTLSGIATNFGLWPLVHQQLAIVSDARLSTRTDQAIVTEGLLSISGEDSVTIDRKNQQPITIKLPTRFLILTNELPRLADASAALSNRFMVAMLERLFLGREDTGLYAKLLPELPGILLWAIKGWQRLRERGHFQQPETSGEAIREMIDLASPVSAFVREWCDVTDPASEIARTELYEAWVLWSKEQGTVRPTEAHVFGRDLKAAIPCIGSGQKRGNGDLRRVYYGIRLTLTGQHAVSVARAAKQGDK